MRDGVSAVSAKNFILAQTLYGYGTSNISKVESIIFYQSVIHFNYHMKKS